jgi:CRISPR-associated Cas5-like protein
VEGTYTALAVKVWGEYACFTRPEMKVERVSYPVLTPSAARGILEAICWKPEFAWHVEEIWVLNEVRYCSLVRNEVNRRASERAALNWQRHGGERGPGTAAHPRPARRSLRHPGADRRQAGGGRAPSEISRPVPPAGAQRPLLRHAVPGLSRVQRVLRATRRHRAAHRPNGRSRPDAAGSRLRPRRVGARHTALLRRPTGEWHSSCAGADRQTSGLGHRVDWWEDDACCCNA